MFLLKAFRSTCKVENKSPDPFLILIATRFATSTFDKPDPPASPFQEE